VLQPTKLPTHLKNAFDLLWEHEIFFVTKMQPQLFRRESMQWSSKGAAAVDKLLMLCVWSSDNYVLLAMPPVS